MTRLAGIAARYGLVIVLVWFGAMKFTYYESHGISPLVANSPFISWVYHFMSIGTFGRVLGTIELITAALLAVKPWFPKASGCGWPACHCLLCGNPQFYVHDARYRRSIRRRVSGSVC